MIAGAGEAHQLSHPLDLEELRAIVLEATAKLPTALKALPGQVERRDALAIQTTILLGLYFALTSEEIDPGRQQVRRERLAPLRAELLRQGREIQKLRRERCRT